MSRGRILLVEDDPHIREMISDQIEMLGFDLATISDGAQGLERALGESFALVLLDVNLPSLGGLEVCRRLKERKPETPVIILSARGAELDKVLGLQLGADDYVVKPFGVQELAARIQARLRTTRIQELGSSQKVHGTIARFDDVEIDVAKRLVRKSGKPVQLTALELDLLLLLISEPGVPFSRADLLSRLWGVTSEVYENSPTPIVTRLRKKLENHPASPTYVLTVWSIGYKFTDQIPVVWE